MLTCSLTTGFLIALGLVSARAETPPKFPSYFERGKILIIPSSHQDIAWMDSIERCVEQRDRAVITAAVELMGKDSGYCFSLENTLSIMEFLARHPDRKERVAELIRSGRLEVGATYNEPYESLYASESLVRQTYLGRRWIKKNLPGCDAVTAWSPDVPGRAMQMPQILSKAGIRHLIISRHEKGFYRWLSPDGTGVNMYTPGLYVDPVGWLWTWHGPKEAPPGGGVDYAVASIGTQMRNVEGLYRKQMLP